MDKRNDKKKLPPWVCWADIEAIAEITGYSVSAVYMMLTGDRKIQPIEEAVSEYKKALDKLLNKKNKLVQGLKDQFQP